MIELRGVSKSYGNIVALQPINLTVATGRTTVLLGPSGCGKSTILRLMLGLLRPDSGSVLVQGQQFRPEMRNRIGYVVQDGGLFPHLTARGNATLMARHIGWDAERIESRLKELAELTRFPADGLDRYPAQLSGGQRQRVSLMRALMLSPDIVLLDEPLAALDPLIRSDLQTDLRKIFETLAKTVVLVTHDLGEAAFLGDHLVLLREGRIAQEGTTADLMDRPANEFVTRFISAQRGLNSPQRHKEHEENQE
jgi:osmoprotectant transport system ATP-binding protein